eukprot:5107313-Karenia_brevis.AAC.1
MFGGLPGVGADDAFYTTALEKELCIIENRPFVGGSLGLYKCFDQVLRPLLYVILLIAGLPSQVLIPYINFLENLKIYNGIAGSLGRPHGHHCGIPQGCPLSMIFISLLLRGWIMQMIELSATP